MVGRKGAITQLASLLPGTNLIAALLAEVKGDRQEAVRAINLLSSWRDAASADGALARVAELLPGVDIISFGLMVNHGHFAHAVRAICKTRWVDIEATSSTFTLHTGCVEDWVVQSVDSDVTVQPRAASLASGLVDVFIHLLDFDRHGNQRWVTRGLEHQLPSAWSSKKRRGLRRAFEDVKIMKANQAMHGILDYLFLSSPYLVEYLKELTNWAIYEWTAETRATRCTLRGLRLLLPPMVCSPFTSSSSAPSARLARAVRDSLPGVVATHGQMPMNPGNFFEDSEKGLESSLKGSIKGLATCETPILAASCLSCAACHALWPIGCLAGCFAGLRLLRRRFTKDLTSYLQGLNAEAYKQMSRPVVPIARQIEQSEELPPERVLDWAAQCAHEEQEDIFEPQGVPRPLGVPSLRYHRNAYNVYSISHNYGLLMERSPERS